MADPGGGVGAKFVSVNLNKSYGQPSHSNHSPYVGSYGQAAAAGRARSGSVGGAGGMVVLSRSRSSQKVAPKLSVPPPLNLPSLRKEHERFDISGSGSGQAGSSGTGSGPRPSSSGMGWSKPVAVSLPEKDESGGNAQVEQSGHAVDGESRAASAYTPPSARFNAAAIGTSSAGSARTLTQPVEKAVVLRGEDFPSLQAALPVSTGPGVKQKENVNQKPKQVAPERLTDQRDSYHLSSPVDMRPQGLASHHTIGNGTTENGGNNLGLGSLHISDQLRKREEYFPGPLPLVRLNLRSDWADDERDTGRGFTDRSRDFGSSKGESYWDRDFDIPRTSILPHKPAQNQYERWGIRDDETGRKFASDVFKLDPHRGDTRTHSRDGREGNVRVSLPLHKDGLNAQEAVNDRNSTGAVTSVMSKDFGKEKYISPHVGDPLRDTVVSGSQESTYAKMDAGHVTEGRLQWNSMKESSFNSQGAVNTQDRYGAEQSNRHRGGLQNTMVSKSLFVSSGKVPPGNDPFSSSGRERRTSSKKERSSLDDSFINSAGLNERDPFTGSLFGVVKRKKDIAKQMDFHDPVRESFEAELERVQKIQELERQRIIEEQERALEKTRREEEERQRLIREEEERRQRLEDEAREAAWRAEQERLEAIRRVEEQKIAREEEKKKILIEEERRKQAAKQKLLELEARMAKRQAKGMKTDVTVKNMDEKFTATVKDKEASSSVDLDTWEDSERMVEKITASPSFDSPVLNRSFDVSTRPYPTREATSSFLEKGKPFNSWRRDGLENGSSISAQLQDQDISHLSPRRDSFANGRAVPRKEFHGTGYMPSRSYLRGVVQEPYADEFGLQKEQRWNFPGEAESYVRSREMDSEFPDNLADISWGQNRFRGHPRPPCPEQSYLHSEADELYSYGRLRYSMRQPRVFPPPSIASTQNASRVTDEHPGSSGFLDSDDHYRHARRTESTSETGYYTGRQDGSEQSELVDMQRENATSEDQRLNKDMTPRCDSQSSVSVSSPPNSPPHLSHDELDEPGDSPMISVRAELKQISLSANESAILNENSGHRVAMTASSSISAVEDDEWALDNNDELQQQEEYDEDEDGYHEEDEAREGDEENIDLNQEFEDLHLDEKGSSHMMDNFVLGFDEGVEVEIPSDDFEANLSNADRGFRVPESSIDIPKEEGLVDGPQDDEQSHGLVEGSSRAALVHEGGKTIQDSVEPIDDPYTSIESDSKTISAKQTIPSSADIASSIGLTIISDAPSAPSQVDIPVKFQFGLFSGPSLIPSPVPAIQIGSIQMPLHLNPPVGPSLTHMHPSQPPIFQFGQLRYPSPISQGVLPIPPQSVPFVQPNLQTHYSLNQNSGSLPIQPTLDTSMQGVMKDDVSSLASNKQPGFVSGPPDQPHGSPQMGFTSVSERECVDGIAHMEITSSKVSTGGDNDNLSSELVAEAEAAGQNDAVMKNHFPSSKLRVSGSYLQPVQTSESISNEKKISGFKPYGPYSGGKGKRFTYAVRNSSTRSSFPDSDRSSTDANSLQRRSRRTVQRTEFRVRENVDRRQSVGSASSNNLNLEERSNYNGRSLGNFAKNGSKRGTVSTKPFKQMADSESLLSGNIFTSQEIDSANRLGKETGKDLSLRGQNSAEAGEGNWKRNASEEDDAPLQSGVVHVFKQPGIEAPSDEDDFIEVRSKRRMFNDRREQREKEIKEKSRVTKQPRKPRATRTTAMGLTNSRKVSAARGGESSTDLRSEFGTSEARDLAGYKEPSATVVSQPLAPIGTPAVKSEVQADSKSQIKPLQTSSLSLVSGSHKDLGPTLMMENKNKVMDNVPTSLSSWDAERANQQVMALTQTQLEEAMKAPRFDTPIASMGGHSNGGSEPLLPSTSILSKDRPFSSAASPINSLLAGEKIQFGAVTSPTLLPPSSWAPGSSRPDIQISHNISADLEDFPFFFEKEKQTNKSCVPLQDSEAEAEAAASAVAVAAISSDEIVGNGLGSVAISDTKSFGGGAGDQPLASQSKAEDSLSVSLPADLSVETPPISLWPPLPSPQSSSGQMPSHFPGGPPSHFPFYEMNPMLGGPIFAFGPHDESAGSQSQTQKSSNTSSSGPLGTWQQCHSTVDSFYGPAAGFTGPFIGPPGGIHGVQGPPHMVVYNHFTPVGQYGQVGLSFIGPTYIPSGKLPDWKHNTPSSAVGMGDGDLNNANIASVQRNPPNMPTSIQHIAQGPPIMPMGSPMAVFDVSPFQSPADISVQARWPHVPASPLHAVPLSRQLQHQAEGGAPSHIGQIDPIDQSINMNRFSEHRSSTPSESGPSFTVPMEVNAGDFTDELVLVDPSRSTDAGASTQTAVSHSSSAGVAADAGKIDSLRNIGSNNSEGPITSGFKTCSSHQKNLSAQQSHSVGYSYQRSAGGSQRNNTGGNDWSHRRMGFHGRSQPFNADKGFPSLKMKQVYVAKQIASGTSTGE